MKIVDFLKGLQKQTNEEVVILAVEHMAKKKFTKECDYSQEEIVAFFSEFTSYMKYLNDFIGKICKTYNTDAESIYYYVCELLDVDSDNESLFLFRLKRLELNTPYRVLSIISDDIKEHNLEHIEEELQVLIESRFYKDNSLRFASNIKQIQENIATIKKQLI